MDEEDIDKYVGSSKDGCAPVFVRACKGLVLGFFSTGRILCVVGISSVSFFAFSFFLGRVFSKRYLRYSSLLDVSSRLDGSWEDLVVGSIQIS